jgi:hypothetical protein
MLAESECLSSAELCALLLDTSQSTFTGIRMFLSSHFYVTLRIASILVIREK